MSKGYHIEPAVSDESIWFILDPVGTLIGSCSSREAALGIAALVNGGAPALEAPALFRPTVSAAPTTVPSLPASVCPPDEPPSPVTDSGPISHKPVTHRPAMFEWYAPPPGSFLKRCCRFVCNGRW